MLYLLYGTLLVFTTFIWGLIFYKKDYHPQPLRVIRRTFLLGLLAVVPVFSYQFIYRNFLPSLSEFQIFRPLIDSPVWSGFLIFFAHLILLGLLLLLLAGIVVVIARFYDRTVFINLKNAFQDEPIGFALAGVLLGGVLYVHLLTQGLFHSPLMISILGSVLFLAIIEEYIKHLIVRIADDKKIRDIDDAITLSITVGLAFAFSETLIFALLAGDPKVIFYRALISFPIHLVASGVFGYYYGLAHFAKPIVEMEEGSDQMVGRRWLPRLLRFRKSMLYHEKKIVEGTFLATVFHAAINLFFEFGIGFLMIPFLMIGMMTLFRFYDWAKDRDRLLKRKLIKQKRAA